MKMHIRPSVFGTATLAPARMMLASILALLLAGVLNQNPHADAFVIQRGGGSSSNDAANQHVPPPPLPPSVVAMGMPKDTAGPATAAELEPAVDLELERSPLKGTTTTLRTPDVSRVSDGADGKHLDVKMLDVKMLQGDASTTIDTVTDITAGRSVAKSFEYPVEPVQQQQQHVIQDSPSSASSAPSSSSSPSSSSLDTMDKPKTAVDGIVATPLTPDISSDASKIRNNGNHLDVKMLQDDASASTTPDTDITAGRSVAKSSEYPVEPVQQHQQHAIHDSSASSASSASPSSALVAMDKLKTTTPRTPSASRISDRKHHAALAVLSTSKPDVAPPATAAVIDVAVDGAAAVADSASAQQQQQQQQQPPPSSSADIISVATTANNNGSKGEQETDLQAAPASSASAASSETINVSPSVKLLVTTRTHDTPARAETSSATFTMSHSASTRDILSPSPATAKSVDRSVEIETGGVQVHAKVTATATATTASVIRPLSFLDRRKTEPTAMMNATETTTVVDVDVDADVVLHRSRRAALNYGVVATLSGHTNYVSSVAYSLDGKSIVSGSYDNSVKIWNVKTKQVVATLSGHTSWVISAAYSPDGNSIVSGSADKTVKIWDVKTKQVVATLSGHTAAIYMAAYSPDGNSIVSCSDDKTVKIWDVKTKQVVATLSGHTGYVYSAAYSPDGNSIVSGSRDSTVKIWDVKTKQVVTTLSGHTRNTGVMSVAYSPDGNSIVSGSSDKTVKIWDVKTKQVVATLSGHTNTVLSVAYSPDGNSIASGSWDKTNNVKIWDVKTKQVDATLSGHTSYVYSVAYSPDGKSIVSGSWDKTVKIWDADGSCTKGNYFDAANNDCKACPDNTYQSSSSHRTTSCPNTQPTCGQGEKYVDSKTAERTCSNCSTHGNQQLTSPHRSTTCDCNYPWSGTNCELCNGANPNLTKDPPKDCNGVTSAQCETFPALLSLCPIACDSCVASTTTTSRTTTTTTVSTTTTTGLCNGQGDPEECGHDEPYTSASCNLDSFAGNQIRQYCPALCDACITTSSTTTTITTTTSSTTTITTSTTSTTTTATSTTTTTGLCNGTPDPDKCGQTDPFILSSCKLNNSVGIQVRSTCIVLCGTCITTTSTVSTTTTITATSTTATSTTATSTTTTTTLRCSKGQYFHFQTAEIGSTHECIACPENEYQELLSHREPKCNPQPLCRKGERISPTSAYNEQACFSCPDWLFQPNDNHRVTECQQASVATCNNAGNFNPGSGKCDCFNGYSGEECSDAAAGCRLLDDGLQSQVVQQDKKIITSVMPPVASISGVSVIVAYGYLLNGGAPNGATSFSELQLKSHVWVWMSVGLKMFDMMTDWSFVSIPLHGDPFESQYMLKANETRRFTETGRYNKDVHAIQVVALTTCACGSLLTFFDIYGSRQRLSGNHAGVASLATLLVILVEDVPQLVINVIYMKTMASTTTSAMADDMSVEDFFSKIGPISITSLVSSILTIFYSMYLLCKGCRSKGGGQRSGHSSTTHNPAYSGSSSA